MVFFSNTPSVNPENTVAIFNVCFCNLDFVPTLTSNDFYNLLTRFNESNISVHGEVNHIPNFIALIIFIHHVIISWNTAVQESMPQSEAGKEQMH
ncbi:hypothetical protein BANRA_04982 [Klebsiella pneumoniae]|nr:hypothetical protein BANRA_04982 [Klebsiella pneumoniae]